MLPLLETLESQDTLVIALVVYAFCYLLAAVMILIAAVLTRLPIGRDLSATTPAMLTPLGVVTGLVIAFLAARVWANFDHARGYVAQEASELRAVVLLGDALPPEIRAAVRNDISTYLRFVESEDWPSMLQGRVSLRQVPPGLPAALATLLAYEPQKPGQQLAQQEAVRSIERALQARRDRILLSEAAISPAQWIVVVLLDALILLTIAMLHVGKHTTTVVNLFVFSTAVAACLVLLMINDRPFNSGGIIVDPGALREVAIQ